MSDEPFGIIADPQSPVSVEVSDGVELRNGAWFAKAPWRKADLGALQHPTGAPWFCGLVISAVSEATLAFAHEDVLERIARTAGRGDSGLAASINVLRERVLRDLSALGYALSDDGPADVVTNRPGALSTAYDYEQDRLIGLHIDDHEKLSWSQREQSRILACANVGWTERYLYVVPLAASQLLRRLARSPDVAMPARELKDAWFTHFPMTEVLRLTLPPRAAYLLNTQNVIHDGGTPAGSVPDVAFLTLGRPT